MEARAKDLHTGQLRFGVISKNSEGTIILEDDGVYYYVDEDTINPFLGEDKHGHLIYVSDCVKNLLGYGIPYVATEDDIPLIQRGEVVLVRTNYGDDR